MPFFKPSWRKAGRALKSSSKNKLSTFKEISHANTRDETIHENMDSKHITTQDDSDVTPTVKDKGSSKKKMKKQPTKDDEKERDSEGEQTKQEKDDRKEKKKEKERKEQAGKKTSSPEQSSGEESPQVKPKSKKKSKSKSKSYPKDDEDFSDDFGVDDNVKMMLGDPETEHVNAISTTVENGVDSNFESQRREAENYGIESNGFSAETVNETSNMSKEETENLEGNAYFEKTGEDTAEPETSVSEFGSEISRNSIPGSVTNKSQENCNTELYYRLGRCVHECMRKKAEQLEQLQKKR